MKLVALLAGLAVFSASVHAAPLKYSCACKLNMENDDGNNVTLKEQPLLIADKGTSRKSKLAGKACVGSKYAIRVESDATGKKTIVSLAVVKKGRAGKADSVYLDPESTTIDMSAKYFSAQVEGFAGLEGYSVRGSIDCSRE